MIKTRTVKESLIIKLGNRLEEAVEICAMDIESGYDDYQGCILDTLSDFDSFEDLTVKEIRCFKALVSAEVAR